MQNTSRIPVTDLKTNNQKSQHLLPSISFSEGPYFLARIMGEDTYLAPGKHTNRPINKTGKVVVLSPRQQKIDDCAFDVGVGIGAHRDPAEILGQVFL